MFKKMVNLFYAALVQYASPKTMRYVVKGDSFKKETVNVLYTLMKLRALGKATTVNVDGDQYFAGDYVGPKNIIDLIKYGKVWSTQDAVEMAVREYSYQTSEGLEYTEDVVDSSGEEETYTLRMLTPDKISNYFKRYNQNQDDDAKIRTASVEFKTDTILADFSALVTINGKKLVKHTENGSIHENVGYFNQVQTPFSDDEVISYSTTSEEALGKWLMSIE